MASKIHLVYFSATGTTAKIVASVAQGTQIEEQQHHNILRPTETVTVVGSDELVVFGVPVFSGRVPPLALEALEKFQGTGTPAIIVCVYGNRAFDDALLELQNSVQSRGFVVVSAGAFVAQHSIFASVGQGRPDSDDTLAAQDFGRQSVALLNEGALASEFTVQGNFPYREVKKIPLFPKPTRECNLCGACAGQCPTQAIDAQNPKKVDKRLCIACAHCIAICPQKARHFSGLLYKMASRKFAKMCAAPQKPYIVYRNSSTL